MRDGKETVRKNRGILDRGGYLVSGQRINTKLVRLPPNSENESANKTTPGLASKKVELGRSLAKLEHVD